MNDAVPPRDVDADDTGRGPSALLGDLDHLLRGRFTTPEQLRTGRAAIPSRTLAVACVALGAIYGAAMGLFAVTTRPAGEGLLQVLSSALKVPLLFLLTLIVTFPSLYVVSALARSKLRAGDTLRLLLAAIAVHLALLASLGPVAAFFTLSTDSYPFMKLLHVAFFAASGYAGLAFLRKALAVIFEEEPTRVDPPLREAEVATPADPAPDGPPPLPPASTASRERGPADPDASNVEASTATVTRPAAPALARAAASETQPLRRVFRVWIVIYGLVGAQMGWILRPFIGAPHLQFAWFRERDSNVLEALIRTFADLFR